MTTLAELKSRHAARKLRDAPLHKILGPDQSYGDMDQALEMIDALKETLRDVAIHMRANPKHNDELFAVQSFPYAVEVKNCERLNIL